MILKTIVIDDEPLAAALIESYVLKTPFLEHCATFSTALEAMGSDTLAGCDLLFLDIQMPGLNGLEFSKLVDPRTRIIFTTAFNQYAIDGYKVNALDYLLKPISYTDFMGAANKALSWFKLTEQPKAEQAKAEELNSIYVKSEYKLLRIDLDNILYVEGLKDYVKFVTEDNDKPILSLMSTKKAEEILPADKFIRVHRSFIVNKSKIKVIERNRIVFDQERIPIGDSYKQSLTDYIKELSI